MQDGRFYSEKAACQSHCDAEESSLMCRASVTGCLAGKPPYRAVLHGGFGWKGIEMVGYLVTVTSKYLALP